MNKILTTDIFTNSVCIFVDASIQSVPNGYIGCPGGVVVYNGNKIEYKDYIKLDATNSRAELAAVQLGIELALKYRHLGPINLFSDSKVCIYSLKEWIFKWYKNRTEGVLYGSSASPVANQDIIINIVNTILYNNLDINLYHQKGHVVTSNQKSMNRARNVFIESNKIDIDIELLKAISYFNNYVDIETKETLIRSNIQNKVLQNAIRFSLEGFNEIEYRKLINKKIVEMKR